MLIFVLISDNPPRLFMLTAGCQCLKYCSFKNEMKCCFYNGQSLLYKLLLISKALKRIFPPPGGGGGLPSGRLMGMCRWMRSHFHDWTNYYGVHF